MTCRRVGLNLVPPGRDVVPTNQSMLEHRLAKLSVVATFLLLVIGGTVNPTGSSLACPEPTLVCHGQLFPPMIGGVFYEHGHRLAAMVVGFLQIALTVAIAMRRKDMRRIGLVALLMVCLQGSLGAITVKYKLPWFVSTAHLMLAISYFGTLIYIAFLTRPTPAVMQLQQHDARLAELGDARKWILIACASVVTQLLIGALVRHHGAAMVCLGVPTCTRGGDWFGTAGVQHLHMFHRVFGVIVAIISTYASIVVAQRAKAWPSVRALAMFAPVLVAGQVLLGAWTVLSMRAVPVAVGHFAGAMSLWAVWLLLALFTAKRTATGVIGNLGERA